MKFQDRIAQIRREKGFSQEELAEQLGISRQAIAKWEAGSSYPDVDNLIALSTIFKVSIDHMLKLEDGNCNSILTKEKKGLPGPAISFLCKAKKECYAGKGAMVASSRPHSYDYRYSEGEYTYLDSYFGGESFAGEEVLYGQELPVYTMNYCGRVLEDNFSGDFLNEALLLVPEEYPFRGPFVHKNGDYSYHCMIHGDIEWFQGYEEIFLLEKKIYECHFHGGLIK